MAGFLFEAVQHAVQNKLTLAQASRTFGQSFCRKTDFSIDRDELEKSYAYVFPRQRSEATYMCVCTSRLMMYHARLATPCSVTQHIIALHEKLFTDYLDVCDTDLEKKREIKRKKEREMMENYKRKEDKERRKEEKKRRKDKDKRVGPPTASSSASSIAAKKGAMRRDGDDASWTADGTTGDGGDTTKPQKRTSSSDSVSNTTSTADGNETATPDRRLAYTSPISDAMRNFAALDIDAGTAMHRRSLSMNSTALAELLANPDNAMPSPYRTPVRSHTSIIGPRKRTSVDESAQHRAVLRGSGGTPAATASAGSYTSAPGPGSSALSAPGLSRAANNNNTSPAKGAGDASALSSSGGAAGSGGLLARLPSKDAKGPTTASSDTSLQQQQQQQAAPQFLAGLLAGKVTLPSNEADMWKYAFFALLLVFIVSHLLR